MLNSEERRETRALWREIILDLWNGYLRGFHSRRVSGLYLLVVFFGFFLTCCGGRKHVNPGFSHTSWKNISAKVYVVDTRSLRIGVYGHGSSSRVIGSFENLQAHLDHAGIKLVFATNGGMFHSDYGPVGLLVEDGVERAPINLSDGDGNFFLKPNGVFIIFDDGKADIARSEKYPQIHRGVRAATQSGPMLVIDGKINPIFKNGSTNRFVRSGIGLINSHTVVFAISDQAINFWDFARLFRDGLGCRNALYLDGVISKFFLPGIEQSAERQEFGVLIGVTEKP